MDYHLRFDVAHLARVELLTPDLDGSLFFFKDLLGMYETERRDGSVYLRCYEDPYLHSLKLTPAQTAGLAKLSWRTSSPEALERRVKALQDTEFGVGWTDGDQGIASGYQFTTPDGHPSELVWEVEKYRAPLELRSKILTRPSRRPIRGLPPKRLDHINIYAADVTSVRNQYEQLLGFQTRERVINDLDPAGTNPEIGAWLSVNLLSHEVAVSQDMTGQHGRLHHVAFHYGVPQHNSDMAEICREYGIQIEVGPDVHGLSQAAFLYVFEPGGNRIELFGNSGLLTLQPDASVKDWLFSDFETALAIGGATIPLETFYTYGTPNAVAPSEMVAAQ